LNALGNKKDKFSESGIWIKIDFYTKGDTSRSHNRGCMSEMKT